MKNKAEIKRLHLIKRLCALLLLAPIVVAAQTTTEKKAAVDTIAALLRRHYVYPSKGNNIADAMQQAGRSGIFDNVKAWKTFDSIATHVLRDAGHDGHLYVRYDPAAVKELRAATTEAEGEDLFFEGAAAVDKNFGFQEIRVLPGNIGYLQISEINISKKSLPVLQAAMQMVVRTRALIIDLRNNGGGGSNIGAVLEGYFLPEGKHLLEVKNRSGRMSLDTVPAIDGARYTQPVFILVNNRTASAAEAFAFVLQANKRATIVGQPSAGAANMNTWYPVNDALIVSVSTAAPVLPGTNTSWEQRGVQPDQVTPKGEELQWAERYLREGK